jgi:hypothetical protein
MNVHLPFFVICVYDPVKHYASSKLKLPSQKKSTDENFGTPETVFT